MVLKILNKYDLVFIIGLLILSNILPIGSISIRLKEPIGYAWMFLAFTYAGLINYWKGIYIALYAYMSKFDLKPNTPTHSLLRLLLSLGKSVLPYFIIFILFSITGFLTAIETAVTGNLAIMYIVVITAIVADLLVLPLIILVSVIGMSMSWRRIFEAIFIFGIPWLIISYIVIIIINASIALVLGLRYIYIHFYPITNELNTEIIPTIGYLVSLIFVARYTRWVLKEYVYPRYKYKTRS